MSPRAGNSQRDLAEVHNGRATNEVRCDKRHAVIGNVVKSCVGDEMLVGRYKRSGLPVSYAVLRADGLKVSGEQSSSTRSTSKW